MGVTRYLANIRRANPRFEAPSKNCITVLHTSLYVTL